jgi:hypothetical protein
VVERAALFTPLGWESAYPGSLGRDLLKSPRLPRLCAMKRIAGPPDAAIPRRESSNQMLWINQRSHLITIDQSTTFECYFFA